MRTQFLPTVLLLILGGCAPLSPQDQAHWTLRGKVTATHLNHSRHLHFVWQHDHAYDHLTLMDPFGFESIRLDREAGHDWDSKEPERLAHRLGFALPLNVLPEWIRGEAAAHPLPPWQVSYPKPHCVHLTVPGYTIIIDRIKWS